MNITFDLDDLQQIFAAYISVHVLTIGIEANQIVWIQADSTESKIWSLTVEIDFDAQSTPD